MECRYGQDVRGGEAIRERMSIDPIFEIVMSLLG